MVWGGGRADWNCMVYSYNSHTNTHIEVVWCGIISYLKPTLRLFFLTLLNVKPRKKKYWLANPATILFS